MNKDYMIAKLAVRILETAGFCANQIESVTNQQSNELDSNQQLNIMRELLFFFMHVTNRIAASKLTQEELTVLHDELGPLITDPILGYTLYRWPDKNRDDILKEIYTDINRAESNYATCVAFFSDTNPLTGNYLFSKLARNIAEHLGYPMNPVVMTCTIEVTMNAWLEMHLEELIDDTRKYL